MTIDIKEDDLIKIELKQETKPQENRRIQALIFNIIIEYSRKTGRMYIKFDTFYQIFIQFFNDHNKITELNMLELIELMGNRYNIPFELILFNNIRIIKIPQMKFTNNFNSLINLVEISEYISNKYFYEIPVELNNSICELKKKIANYEQEYDISYLTTNPLDGSIDISKKIGEIIQKCDKFLFFSIPYYDYEINFLINLLDEKLHKQKILNNPLDFRVLYRDDESAKKFVMELAIKLQDIYPSGFWKKFNRQFLVKRVTPNEFKRIGNLHSKMIISEIGVLIGSANLTNNSLISNYETAFFTNKPQIIQVAKENFENVWSAFYEPNAF